MTILLSTDDTEALCSMSEAIESLEESYKLLAEADAVYRPRSDMVVPLKPGEDYWLATMEGAIRSLGVAAIRLRSDRYVEQEKDGKRSAIKWAKEPGLYCGLLIVYSTETAEPLAIVCDGYLQVMRVAATSALAGKYLARPESSVLGIIGAGFQALSHARAYAALFPLKEIRLYARSYDKGAEAAAELSEELGITVNAVHTAREAVSGCDIVATCTTAQNPVLDASWIDPGTYVSCIRYYKEIGCKNDGVFDVYAAHPPEYGWQAYRAGTADDWEQGSEGGDLYQGQSLPASAVALHDVVGGRVKGRTDDQQRTVFNNHAGMGTQFAALGKLVHDRALEQGIGRNLPTEWFLQDITT